MAGHQIDDPKIAFAYLRPSCVLLTKEPTLSNVEALSGHLCAVGDRTLQLLQDYVLFPLRFVLKTPGVKKESVVQAVMEALSYVLDKTCVQSWESLRDLFSEINLCLCSPNDPGKPAPASEELKLAVLRCLDALMHSAYDDVVFKLYEPAMLPGLGAAVSVFLALAEQEKGRAVQVAALNCLLSLFLQCNCERTHAELQDEERYILGSTLASFLPGITRALCQVISGDVRQGHAVTVKAMRVWYTTVGLVMADTQLQNAESVQSSELGRVGELIVRRTPSWSKSTSKRLSLALQKVISYTSAHQHWRVRLELVNLSEHLLSRCSKSLGECFGPLLEALVGAINDEEPRVKERCSSVLSEVAKRNQSTGGQALTDILSENLHSLASSLPRLMRTTDDQRKLFVLNVFLGYLKILGPKVDMVLTSAAHLQRISKALLQVLELEVTDVRIVEERSLVPLADLGPDSHKTQNHRKYFLYFTDDKIFSALKQICRMLGHYGNLYLLVDHFLELYKESSVYRKQSALVLNEIITGTAGLGMEAGLLRMDDPSTEDSRVNQEELKGAVMSIIEEYISLNNWHLPTVMVDSDSEQQDSLSSVPPRLSSEGMTMQLVPTSSGSSKGPTLHQLNSNVWQLCIQLEGIGSFALALGTDFHLLLMTSLYPVLEKAGDPSLLVSQSAVSTMHNLCIGCSYSSAKELIISNSDYLLNDVSLNLARPAVHPNAPQVLSVMFTHSDASLLPLVVDVMQDVLTALDLSYDQKSLQFSSVLHSLMKAMVRWFPTSKKHSGQPSTASVHPNNPDLTDLRQFLLDYKKEKELSEGIGIEEDGTCDTEISPAPAEGEDGDYKGPDVKPELPLHVSLAKDVMERCIHLLAHPSMGVRLKVLDIVELCVHLLCELENELLPMVHRCWPALLQRLTNDDPRAIPRAFRVLCVLGETCGDFLRQRVSKEVLPRLTSSLSRHAETSARSGPLYTHTLAYKLQLAVLQGLGPLCVQLDLVDSDLDRVTEACLPYLSCRQPIRLQEACLSVFQHLMQLDPDSCWFTLNELYCPVAYEPPHALLFPVKLSGTNQPKNEYTHNVVKLLHMLNSPQGGQAITDTTDASSSQCRT